MSPKQRIYEILQAILEVEISDSTPISMQICSKWTSLAHIDIIMSLEEEFGIAFGEDELPLLNSKEALVSRVEALIGRTND